MPDFTPEDVREIARLGDLPGGSGLSGPYQPPQITFTPEEVRQVAGAKLLTPARRFGRGALGFLGKLEEADPHRRLSQALESGDRSEMLRAFLDLASPIPGFGPLTAAESVQQEFRRAVSPEKATPPEEQARVRRERQAVPPALDIAERAARIAGIPFQAVGIPVSGFAERLGRGLGGETETLGEAAAEAATYGALGLGMRFGRGGGPPGTGARAPGARGPTPPPGAEPRPGVRPGARPGPEPGPRPGPRSSPEPGPSPTQQHNFYWGGKRVNRVAWDARAQKTGKVRLDFDKGSEYVDPREFVSEAWRQRQFTPFEYRGKTVVDIRLDPEMRRHQLFFEDGSATSVTHQTLVEAYRGRPPGTGPAEPDFAEAFRQQQRARQGYEEARPGAPPPPRAEPPPPAPGRPTARPGPRPARPPRPSTPPPVVPETRVARPGLAPRPEPPTQPPTTPPPVVPSPTVPAGEPTVVRPRAPRRGRGRFDPDKHSLSDFVRIYGVSFGRGKPIPEELWEGIGDRSAAGRLFRREKGGFGADELPRLAQEEGGFNLPPDMNEGELLALVAQDYRAKRSGDRRRIWSGMRQFTEAELPKAEQARITSARDTMQQAATAIEEALARGDLDAARQGVRTLEDVVDRLIHEGEGRASLPAEELLDLAERSIEEYSGRLEGLEEPGISEPPALPPGSELQAALEAATAAVEGQNLTPEVRTAIDALPPVPSGHVRLYRWTGPGAVKAGAARGREIDGWFETSPGLYFTPGTSPSAGRYLDIPVEDFQRYQADPNATEVQLPEELVRRAEPLSTTPAPLVPEPKPGLTQDQVREHIRDAVERGDPEAELRWRERLAILQEGQKPPKGALDFPPRYGEEGYIDISDILNTLRGRKRKTPPPSFSPEYQEVLAARRASGARRSILDVLSDLPVELIRRFLNKDVHIHRVADEVERHYRGRHGGADLPSARDPRLILDLVRGGTDGRINVVTLELSRARSSAINDGLLEETTSYLDLTGWRRGIQIIEERMDRAFQEGVEAAAAGNHAAARAAYEKVAEYRKRIANGEIAPKGYTKERINQEIDELQKGLSEDAWTRIQNHADRVWEINRRVWDLLHEMEVISDAVYEQGISRGKEYVPLYRIHEEFLNDPEWGGFNSLNAATRKSLKRFEGSTLATMDPYEASHVWASRAIRDAAKNEAMRVVHDLKELDPEGLGKLIVDLPRADMRPPSGFEALSYYVKGQKRRFALPRAVAQSLLNTTPRDVSTVGTVLQAGRLGLYYGAVGANLAFAVPNIARDVGRFWAMTRASKPLSPKRNAELFLALGRALGHVLRQDGAYMEMLWDRAAGGTMARTLSPHFWTETPWTQKMNPLVHTIRTVSKIVNVLEETSKMASYQMHRQMGMDPAQAAHETRRMAGTPDYRRQGSDSPMLNLAFMFFNVGIQGKASSLGRFWKSPRRLAEIAVAGMLVALAVQRWNSQFRDEEGNPEWERVPDYDRAKNGVILTPWVNPETGRHGYIKIPLAEEFRALYKPLESGLWEAMGESDPEMKDYYQDLVNSGAAMIPFFPDLELGQESVLRSLARGTGSSLNPVLREPVEQLANLDLFRNRPIVPRGMEDIAPSEQFTARTSPTAVVLGRAMGARGVSPLRIEHAARGTFAGLGEQALQVADPLMARFSPQPQGLYRGAETAPVIGPVVRRLYSEGWTDNVMRDLEDQFYHYLSEASEATRTYNHIAETDPERAGRWLLDDPKRMTLRSRHGDLRAIATEVSGLRELRHQILDNPAMPDEEKAAQSVEILNLQRQRILLGIQLVDEVERAADMPFVTPPPGQPGQPAQPGAR